MQDDEAYNISIVATVDRLADEPVLDSQPIPATDLSVAAAPDAEAPHTLNGHAGEVPVSDIFVKPLPRKLQGHIDRANGIEIVGWVWDPDAPEDRVRLELVDGSGVIATAVADIERPGLEKVCLGDGRHEFRFALRERLTQEGEVQLHLRCSDSLSPVPGSPITIVADRPQPQPQHAARVATEAQRKIASEPVEFGYCDSVTASRIEGWACDPANPDLPLAMEVLIDGQYLCCIECNRPRYDSSGRPVKSFGFLLEIPTGFHDSSTHNVSFRTTDGRDISLRDGSGLRQSWKLPAAVAAKPLGSRPNAAPTRSRPEPTWSKTEPPKRSPVGLTAAELKARIQASRLFDARWYANKNGLQFESPEAALQDYLDKGAEADLDPNPLFDSKFYQQTYMASENTGEPGFFHYLRTGIDQDFSPSILIDPKWVKPQLERLKLKEGVLSAILHKCAPLKLDPHPCFSVGFYMRRYPEIAQRNIHPVSHYLQNGWRERRLPHPLFWPEWFLQAGEMQSDVNPLAAYLLDQNLFTVPPNPFFHTHSYQEAIPETRTTNPLRYYLETASTAQHAPNPGLDMAWARDTFRLQLAKLGLDPLTFLLMHENGFVFGNPSRKRLALTEGADPGKVAELHNRALGVPAAATRRRRLLYLSHNLKIQGAQTSLFELATGMSRDPLNEVLVLAPDDGPMKDRYTAAGIPVHKYILPARGLADGKHYCKLLSDFSQQIYDLAPDIVQGNTIQAYHAIALATRAGIPAVWNIRESEDPASHFSQLEEGAKELLTEAIASPAEFVFVSRATEALWVSAYPKIRHTCINNGINYANFFANSRNVSRPVARAEFGVRDGEILLFNVGTWTERKGQLDIFHALPRIDRRLWPRLRVLLIGRNRSPYAKLLMDEFLDMPSALRERIIVIDESDSAADRALVLAAFNAADIFLFTSRIESYPRVVNEALYFGLPIIATPCFGVLEQLEPEVSGLFYDAGDPGRLARRIVELAIDTERRADMGRRARLAAEHDVMQYEDMLDQYKRLCNGLIKP